MANFTVQFPLRTEKYQEDILNKRFEIGRKIYNSLVSVTQKRYREMIKTKEYRNLISSLSNLFLLNPLDFFPSCVIFIVYFSKHDNKGGQG